MPQMLKNRKIPRQRGPYTVKEFISGSGATIVANDNFWQTDEEYLKICYLPTEM